MTRLFIDGKEVALPEEFELDFYTLNPFFTRKGSYTYDLDIDLYHPQNRQIYKYLNRADTTQRPQNRQAVLLCGPVNIISGTEIILSVDDNIAKIQIVAGNSELNYLTGGEKRLRELDFGTCDSSLEAAYASLEHTFPDFNFVCPPIFTSYDTLGDFRYFDNQMDIKKGETTFFPDTYISPQPYLLFYIEELVKLLGYRLQKNMLRENKRWCRLFLVNGYRTTSFAKMLPDWTVDEFLDEIEKFFNCIFLVNQSDKTVQILTINSFYDDAQLVCLSEIKDDDIIKTYDVEEELAVDYDNVEYDFPDIEDYKYSSMSQEVRELCETKTYFQFYDIWPFIDVEFDKRIIYHSNDYNLDFVASDINGLHRLRIVNRFLPVNNNPDGDTALLKIIPAEVYVGASGTSDLTVGAFTAAYARNNNAKDETFAETGLNQLIKEGVPEENAPDKIYVCFYMGYQGLFVGTRSPTLQYSDYQLPMSAADTYYYINTDSLNFLLKYQDEELTLKLSGIKGLYENFYKNNLKIDTRTEYQFSFLSDSIYDPKSIFLIRNKKYFCKELHYTINKNGLNRMVQGTFYLIE